MDYKQGLVTLRKLAEGTDWFEDFLVYEARLLENLHQERLYGSNEQTRATRAQIVDQLNRLAYQHFSTSFIDLCQPDLPTISASASRMTEDSKQTVQKESSSASASLLSPTDVFISYSHADKRFLKELHTHLAPYVRSGTVNAWDDTMIPAGTRWYEEITRALQSAKIAILLVSPDFLASNFIARKEIPPLLKSAEQKGLTILSVILRPCAFFDTELAQFQAVNAPSNPLSSMKPAERDKVWTSVAASVKKLL